MQNTILIFLFCVLSACASHLPQKEPIPKELFPQDHDLTEMEAIHIASEVAIRHDIDLKSYEEPTVSIDGSRWFIMFESNEEYPAFGAHFSVSIDTSTKTTFYSPGR